MRTLISALLSLLFLVALTWDAQGAVLNDHRTKGSGEWGLASTWQRYNGSTWIDAENPPATSDAAVNVLSGHSISVQYDASIDQLTIDEGGTISVESGAIFTIADGTGDDLTVHGMLDIIGTLQFNGGGGGFKVFGTVRNSGTLNGSPWYYVNGKYQHNYTSTVGSIPAAAWYGNSTMEVIGYTSFTGNLSVGAQTFINITWNCPNQTGAINAHSYFSGLTGTFTVASTGSGSLVFNNTASAKIYSVNGGFVQSGGTIDMASSSGSTNIDVDGDVSLLGGTLTETGSVTSYLRFTNTTTQNFTVNNAHTTANDVDFRGYAGCIVALTQNTNIDAASMLLEGTLSCGQYVLTGAGFSMFPYATLSTGHDNGIAASAATGSIQTTSRSYSTEAYYVYNHPSSMSYSGDGIPSTVSRLTSANTGGSLQLEKDVTVNEQLILTSPIQVGTSGGNALTLGATATYSGSSYISLDNAGKFVRYINGNGTRTLPVGTAGAPSPVSVTVTASGFAAPHLDVTIADAKHASNTSTSNYLTRTWTLAASGITSPSYDLSFTYPDADIVGVETGIFCGRYSGSAWLLGNQTDHTTNTMSITGISALGDFTGGEAGALPVQISSFTAISAQNGVTLSWKTSSEVNNYGFHVQRRAAGTHVFEDMPGAFVPGNGTSIEEHAYSFSEPVPGPGNWEYRLRQIDLDGRESYSDIISLTATTDVEVPEVPVSFGLDQNFPNPFNPSTTVRFALPAESHVRIELLDMLGRTVRTLVDEVRGAGRHDVVVDARMLASGTYLCRMHAGSFHGMIRMALIK